MKAIIEYSDFRQYMRDFYEERKLRQDRKSTCLNSSHIATSRMPSSA